MSMENPPALTAAETATPPSPVKTALLVLVPMVLLALWVWFLIKTGLWGVWISVIVVQMALIAVLVQGVRLMNRLEESWSRMRVQLEPSVRQCRHQVRDLHRTLETLEAQIAQWEKSGGWRRQLALFLIDRFSETSTSAGAGNGA